MFILVYSTTPVVQVRAGLFSTAMRSGHEREALHKLDSLGEKRIISVELSGFLFFGAALQLSDAFIEKVRSLNGKWIVLDFTRVTEIDATSARALSKLVSTLRTEHVLIAISGIVPETKRAIFLGGQSALPGDEDIATGHATLEDNLDEALAWCERKALEDLGVKPPETCAPSGLSPISDSALQLTRIATLLAEYLPRTEGKQDSCSVLKKLAYKLKITDYNPGEVIFTAGDKSDSFFLLLEGTAFQTFDEESAQESPMDWQWNHTSGRFTFEPGALMGEVDFHMRQRRSYTAKAGKGKCRLSEFTRAMLTELEGDDPTTALLAQQIALRSVCMLVGATYGLHGPETPAAKPKLSSDKISK